jgi:hypothetical protein
MGCSARRGPARPHTKLAPTRMKDGSTATALRMNYYYYYYYYYYYFFV